jgi:hypothetical protein
METMTKVMQYLRTLSTTSWWRRSPAQAGYLVTEGVYGLKAAIKISPILEDD